MTRREIKYETEFKPLLNEQRENKVGSIPTEVKVFNFSSEHYRFSSAYSGVIFASFNHNIQGSVWWSVIKSQFQNHLSCIYILKKEKVKKKDEK